MKRSAGLAIIQDNKILVVHPTGSKWYGTYSIPKGEMEDEESVLETAVRETAEEIGVEIYYSEVDKSKRGTIYYKDALGETYKAVYYYVVRLDREIILDPNRLQKKEVDWAGFMAKEEASTRIFWRFRPLLDLLQ